MLSRQCSSSSSSESSYGCYDAYVRALYERNGANHTCRFVVESGVRSISTALAYLETHFPDGDSVDLFVDKNIGGCTTRFQAEVLAIVGVISLSVAFLSLVLWAIVESVACVDRVRVKLSAAHHHQQSSETLCLDNVTVVS